MKNSLAYLIICSLCLVSCSIDYIPLQKSSDPASILPDENRINVRMAGDRLGPGRSWYLYSRLTYRDGALEHFEPPYDTLFRYEDKAWQAEWILEIGPNKIPFDAYTDAMRFNEVLADYTFISSLFETKDYFFIRGVVKRAMKMVLADKNSLEARNCVYTNEKLERPFLYQGLINDIDGGFPFWPRSYYKDEYLLTLVGAMDLLDFKPAITDGSSFQKKDREKLENLVQNIDLEANPVIMLVKLK